MLTTIEILSQLGEPALRPLVELDADMEAVDSLLQSTTDESILNMTTSNEKTFVSLMYVV